MTPLNPRAVFESHYRSADMLLRVYLLLNAEGGPRRDHAMIPGLRAALACDDEEDVILLLNNLFVGLVREEAQMNLAFFRRDNIDLLLRQAIVAACSALDTFLPAMLEYYLPDIVKVRQRNFLPADRDAKELLRDFAFKIDDIWLVVDEVDMDGRLGALARRVIDHCSAKTLSNEAGIAAIIALLGTEGPWIKIAERMGEKEAPLREKARKIVSRRNDIVHRADRSKTNPQGPAQPIDYTWTHSHVTMIRSIALACCDLAELYHQELFPDETVLVSSADES